MASVRADCLMLIVALMAPLSGCAGIVPAAQTALSATRAIALGALEIIDFIEEKGGPQDMADAARKSLRERDYGKALAACYLAVEQMRDRGVLVPSHIDRALYMVRGALAAQVFDDLAKAMRSTLDE